MKAIALLRRHMPVLTWGRDYRAETLQADLLAAVIVTIMLIPQSLAYAMLAGLPPEAGIYASILPILLYAVFGTSRALAVGPVAVVSLMTAAAVGEVAAQGTAGYAAAALTLAFLSGTMLLVMGLFRLGFVANFLSHTVIVGVHHRLGHPDRGEPAEITSSASAPKVTRCPNCCPRCCRIWPQTSLSDAADRRGGAGVPVLGPQGRAQARSDRAGLRAAAGRRCRRRPGRSRRSLVTTAVVWALGLDGRGVAIVGEVPQSLPPLTMPDLSTDLVGKLLLPALLISIIGFVESISVAQTLAAKKRQRIDPNQELIGLGAANLGAAFTGGYPVTGGFARSVVNFDAGAATPRREHSPPSDWPSPPSR